MPFIRLRPWHAMVVALLALFLALGAPAVWGHGGDGQKIHACVTDSTGAVSVIADNTGFGNPDSRCQRPSEQHALDWNVTGPAGPAGPTGAAGPPGPQGLPGAAAAAAADLKWYVKGLPGATMFVGGTAKVTGSLPVPGGNTYLAHATVIVSSTSHFWLWCYLVGNSKPGYGGNPVPGVSSGGSAGKFYADFSDLSPVFRGRCP